MSENDLQTFMSFWGGSKIAQLFSPKFDTISSPVSRYIATTVYFKVDWSPDQVSMMWNFDVKDLGAFVKGFAAFTDA